MTDPCLDNVHQDKVTQLNPSKIQVPFTSGITRTFENTLLAALIIFRDVSPSLSLWEAFDMQKEVIVRV